MLRIPLRQRWIKRYFLWILQKSLGQSASLTCRITSRRQRRQQSADNPRHRFINSNRLHHPPWSRIQELPDRCWSIHLLLAKKYPNCDLYRNWKRRNPWGSDGWSGQRIMVWVHDDWCQVGNFSRFKGWFWMEMSNWYQLSDHDYAQQGVQLLPWSLPAQSFHHWSSMLW